MTQQLSKEQRTVQNAAKFRDQFKNLFMASIPVTMIRTREPARVILTLKDFTFGEDGLAFKVWRPSKGWQTFDKDRPTAAPTADNAMSLPNALQKIHGMEDQEGFPEGVFVLRYPHAGGQLANPIVVDFIKECAERFIMGRRRLVLVVPPTVTLEPELEDDVIILDFESPSHAELGACFDTFMAARRRKAEKDPRYKDKIPAFTTADRDRFLSIGAGMTKSEFDGALARGVIENLSVFNKPGFGDAVAESLNTCKIDAIKKTNVLEMIPAEDMSNIGGLEPLKAWLRLRVNSYSDDAREFGIEPPKGILLIGPQGTGKSLVSKAIAHMLRQPLIRFDASRVFQGVVGGSEQMVRAVLQLIDSMAPCVVMLDELDKIFGGTVSGAQGDSGVGQRVLGTILTWQQDRTVPVFLVATANRAQFLPPEMVRRGRMDEIFSIRMPSKEERREIIQIHMRKRGHDYFDEIADIAQAIEASEGYVGAEIESAVKDALLQVFNAEGKKGRLTGAVIAQQLMDLKPMSVAFRADMEAMDEWAKNNAKPANSGDVKSPGEIVRQRVRPAAETEEGTRDLQI